MLAVLEPLPSAPAIRLLKIGQLAARLARINAGTPEK